MGDTVWIIVTALAVSLSYLTANIGTDVPWHIATGEWIRRTGTIPSSDPFSYASTGQPWIYVNWLADLFLYALHSIGGDRAIILAKAVNATAFLSLSGLSASSLGAKRWSCLATVLLLGVLLQARYTEFRPMAIGATMLAATTYIVCRDRPTDGQGVWLLPAATWVWVGVHGNAILAPAIAVGLLLLHTRAPARARALLILAAVLLPFWVTRTGREVVEHVVWLEALPLGTQWIPEWTPTRDAPHVFVAIGSCGVSALVLLKPAFTGDPAARLGVWFGLLGCILGLTASRNAYEGLVLAAPALGYSMERLARLFHPDLGRWVPAAVVSACLFAHVRLMPTDVIWDHNFFRLQYALDDEYPVDLLPDLRALGPRGRWVHDVELGGWLLRNVELPGGVFFDTRLHVAYGAFLEDVYAALVASPEAFERRARELQGQFVISRYDSRLYTALATSSWHPIAYGRTAAIFAAPEQSPELSLDPLRIVFRGGGANSFMARWYQRVWQSPDMHARFLVAFDRVRRRDSDNPVLTLIARYVFERFGERILAEESRSRAESERPVW